MKYIQGGVRMTLTSRAKVALHDRGVVEPEEGVHQAAEAPRVDGA